jgi:anti-sigma B factor antagonist
VQPLHLDIRRTRGVVILTVAGSITLLDPPGRIKATIDRLLREGDRNIVLSLGQLALIDSSFIGELVSCSLAIARAGGTLKLSKSSRRVQELLLVTRLGEIFESHETDAAAVASFPQ